MQTERAEHQPGRQPHLDECHRAERDRVAEQQVELVKGHRQQPLERAGCPLAEGRDRRDEEHRDEREDPEKRGSDPVEGLRRTVEDPLQ